MVGVLIEIAKLVQQEDEELECGVGASRQMIRMTNEEKHTALRGAVFHKNVDVVKILT